jgi:protein-serine/threonine kinase
MLSFKKILRLSDHSVDQIDKNGLTKGEEEFFDKLSVKLDKVKHENEQFSQIPSGSSKNPRSSVSRNIFGFSSKKDLDHTKSPLAKSPLSKSPLSISPTVSSSSIVSGEIKKKRENRWFGLKEKSEPMSNSTSNVSERNKSSESNRRSNSVSVRRNSTRERKRSGLIHDKSATNSRSASIPPSAPEKPRFKMLENGSHEHYLRAAKGQEKLSSMIKDLLGAKKLRDEAKSALNIPSNPPVDTPPTLLSGLIKKAQKKDLNTLLDNLPTEMKSITNDTRCFVEKYGRCQEVIGKGSYGVVRASHKKVVDDASNVVDVKLYAVKEFKRKVNEPENSYTKRLTSEFVISSSLKNLNIIETLDLLKDANNDFCVVMEYCAGGDLYTLIVAAGKLEYAEADCFFKQLIRGVNYMHDMGIAHRDLKPENLLVTQTGVIKITDFGNSECFKVAWDLEIQLSQGICGSSPYIAPEEFVQKSFDPRNVDIWSCGVIYMAMRTGRQLWKLADPSKDEFFQEYLTQRKEEGGYEPIESLKRARCRNVIYSILDPKPERRITGEQILNSEWGREIKVCDAGEGKSIPVTPSPEIHHDKLIAEEIEDELPKDNQQVK